MALTTISEVTRTYGISTRMLRYYEEIGLLQSKRRAGYAYRVYDEAACTRLRQILVLRKLRIPLKQIAAVLTDPDAAMAAKVFSENIARLDGEVRALNTIRLILTRLTNVLHERAGVSTKLDLLNDETLKAIVDSLPPSPNLMKEERPMEESLHQALNQADDILSKLTDVRIVYLPPSAVAASHYIGPESENHAGTALENFIREVKLWEVKPDLRSYGFNHPNEVKGTDYHGYEFWVTIPEDMEVPPPLKKKHFAGGLYAAHMIPMGNFHEWEWLWRWGVAHPDYDLNTVEDGGECMNGLLEECLNYIHVVRKEGLAGNDSIQLDLLLPIKPKRI